MAESATIAQTVVFLCGRSHVNTAAQKKDTDACTTVAARNKRVSPAVCGMSMAPAARVPSIGSPPVAHAYTVEGMPLSSAAHAPAAKTSRK